MAQRQLARDAKSGARQATAHVARSPWVRTAARVGYVAIGAVYILIGVLALRVAFGAGGETPDQGSALQEILGAPFGRAILGIVAVGLFGYTIWRLVEAFADVRGKGTEPDGLGARAGYALNGIAYGGLGLQSARLALGMGAGSGGASQQQEWTARLMELPLGRWLVGLGGLVVVGIGLFMIYRGWTRGFRENLMFDQMSEPERKIVDRVGVAGYAAHGVVLAIIGVFLLQAAVRFDAQEAQGLGGALAELASQPYGPWLLGVVALGLVAYGIYKLAEARYSQYLGR